MTSGSFWFHLLYWDYRCAPSNPASGSAEDQTQGLKHAGKLHPVSHTPSAMPAVFMVNPSSTVSLRKNVRGHQCCFALPKMSHIRAQPGLGCSSEAWCLPSIQMVLGTSPSKKYNRRIKSWLVTSPSM